MKEQLKRLGVKIARALQWSLISLAWIFYIALWIAMLIVPFAIVILPIVWFLIIVFVKLKHMKYVSYASQNIIVHGGRGKGKGILFQYLINQYPRSISNIDYFNDPSRVVLPETFFNSIKPNNSLDMIKGKITKVEKTKEWEGIPYLLDDTAVYFPNYQDNILKQLYPSISLKLPIQRHLYDSFTAINVQQIERVYKILRELQTDGYIKALSTKGRKRDYIWNRLPVLRKYIFVKWRFHENLESAMNNILPFEKMGLINRATDPLFTTTASALKEMYTGQNGEIKDGFIFLKRKHIYYDTRYFHDLIFTETLAEIEEEERLEILEEKRERRAERKIAKAESKIWKRIRKKRIKENREVSTAVRKRVRIKRND